MTLSKLSPKGQFHQDFWTFYVNRFPDEQQRQPANAQNARWREVEELNLVVSAFLAQTYVGVFIRGPKGANSENTYNLLKPYAEPLAARLGVKIGQPGTDFLFNRSCSGDMNNPENWGELADWLHNTTNAYEMALRDVLPELISSGRVKPSATASGKRAKPTSDPTELPLVERLRAIVPFLGVFEQAGRDPFPPALSQFVQTAYDYAWVRPVDWGHWIGTPEAEALRDDPSVLAQATEEQLIYLTTACIRQERFCEGVLEAHYQAGLFTRILKRAAAMLQEIEAAEVGDSLKTRGN